MFNKELAKGSLKNHKGLQNVIQNLFWFNKEPCLVLQIDSTLKNGRVLLRGQNGSK